MHHSKDDFEQEMEKNKQLAQSRPIKKIQTLVCVKPNIDIGGWHQTVKNHIGCSDLFVCGFI